MRNPHVRARMSVRLSELELAELDALVRAYNAEHPRGSLAWFRARVDRSGAIRRAIREQYAARTRKKAGAR